MNHKGKLWTLSHIFTDNFKTSLQHIFEWDCMTYKSIQVSTFVSANASESHFSSHRILGNKVDLSAWSSDLWFFAGSCEPYKLEAVNLNKKILFN